MHRRKLLSAGSAILAAGFTAPSWAAKRAAARQKAATVVLVHGAWHGAWCWAAVAARLAAAGVQSVAVDLPGHGTGAAFPAGYLDTPQDLVALASSPSPLAKLDIGAYRQHVMSIIDGLVANGSGPVVLIGHSLGGVTLNALGESSPQLIHRLVYLAALNPIAKDNAGAYFGDAAFAASKALPLFIGDPAKTGAIRFNNRSSDRAFRAAAKAAFYADFTDDQFAATAGLLTPDEPAAVFSGKASVSATKWGRIPRTYIRCTEDQAIPIAAQDQFIAEADTLTPGNRYEVRTLKSSHSPFVSMPGPLAKLIAEAAGAHQRVPA